MPIPKGGGGKKRERDQQEGKLALGLSSGDRNVRWPLANWLRCELCMQMCNRLDRLSPLLRLPCNRALEHAEHLWQDFECTVSRLRRR